MKIDRSNYETWFIDWLDGNLNESQAGQLKTFLAENHDLAEELQEVSEIRLITCENEFRRKSSIQKNPSDLSGDQFDNLCARYIENDLSVHEKNELLEIISADPERKKIFDLFSNLKLVPYKISYIHKKSLLRRTPLQNVVRISVTALSAAASVAILIVTSYFLSDKDTNNEPGLSQYIYNDGRVSHSSFPIAAADYVSTINRPDMQRIQSYPVAVNDLTAPEEISENNQTTEDGQIIQRVNLLTTVALPDYSDIKLAISSNGNYNLQELNFTLPEESEDRWAVGKFLAKSFREKILKQDTSDESPIKGYEIAEAGVTGINKLLGWQMALEKNSDPNGEVKSVYFSSKILKIQTPVNRPESAE
jgi:hypothetical protein